MKKYLFRFVFIFTMCFCVININDVFALNDFDGITTNLSHERICFYRKIKEYTNQGGLLGSETEKTIAAEDATYYAVKLERNVKRGSDEEIKNSKWKIASDSNNKYVKPARITDFSKGLLETIKNDFYVTKNELELNSCPNSLYYYETQSVLDIFFSPVISKYWQFDYKKDDVITYAKNDYKNVEAIACEYKNDYSEGSIILHVLQDNLILIEDETTKEVKNFLLPSDFMNSEGNYSCLPTISINQEDNKIRLTKGTKYYEGNAPLINGSVTGGYEKVFTSVYDNEEKCDHIKGTVIKEFEEKIVTSGGRPAPYIKDVTYKMGICNITVYDGSSSTVVTEKVGSAFCKKNNYFLSVDYGGYKISSTLYSCTKTSTPTLPVSNDAKITSCKYNSVKIDGNDVQTEVEVNVRPSYKSIVSVNIKGCGNDRGYNILFDDVYDGTDCKPQEEVFIQTDLSICSAYINRKGHLAGARVCGIFKAGGKLIGIVKTLYQILRISIPVLILCLTIVEFLKVLFNGEGKTMKEAFKATASRFILLAVFVLLPFIISFITRLAGIYDTCYTHFI